jgi:hypothetical protein
LRKEITYLPFAIENQSIFILISCFPNILWAHMLGVDKFLLDFRIVIVEYHLESECILLFDQTSPKSKWKFLVSKPAFFYRGKKIGIL